MLVSPKTVQDERHALNNALSSAIFTSVEDLAGSRAAVPTALRPLRAGALGVDPAAFVARGFLAAGGPRAFALPFAGVLGLRGAT